MFKAVLIEVAVIFGICVIGITVITTVEKIIDYFKQKKSEKTDRLIGIAQSIIYKVTLKDITKQKQNGIR